MPLETAVASGMKNSLLGMNLWISLLVVSTNIVSALYIGVYKCTLHGNNYYVIYYNMCQYSSVYCTCDIIEMWKCLRYWYHSP